MTFIKNFRIWFYYFRRDFWRYLLLKKIIQFGKTEFGKSQFENEIEYIKTNGLVIFPYDFEKKYKHNLIEVNRNLEFPFVDFFGKELFFQSGKTDQQLSHYFNSLLAEQDLDSPHLYCTENFKVEINDTIIDLGVAEANFSLMNIDLAKRVYLFESNIKWIEPLQYTFEPYQNKVHIINKFVSAKSSGTSIALDDIDEIKNESLFIKIDVDGEERQVLNGMIDLLKESKRIKVAICTYHKDNDAKEFKFFFEELGFITEFSSGYMLFYHDKKIRKPYFRKGVLRAWKIE
ncbi:FkbM family methyltransferase [Algoriphagus algorifonticola]|uniref:FkbM family methyltransferase n=1 Tax=Algoriphagus algorifonticola TaxID=2593007 RepID=UPI0011A1B08D|nr:hypothetical protein [Algoriphagus algorifonticola]